MSGSWFFDANFNGISDDFFDDVIKFVDFPLEDVDACNNGEDWEAGFKELETPPANVLASLSFSDDFGSKTNDIKKEDVHSYGDTFTLPTQGSTYEQPSGSQTTVTKKSTKKSTNGKDSFLFQTSSPVSVLESSSSCSVVENAKPFDSKLVFRMKGTRSKRRPHSTFHKLHSLPFLSTVVVATTATTTFSASGVSHAFSSASESESETRFADTTARKKLKKKKRNLTILSSGSSETKKAATSDQQVVTRKCMHCEVTKTPQWREGPMGPKTLCNACGVRYRSGRLLPEYRPAASPTFVPTIHSNSHKKVVEMRKKCSGPVSSGSGSAAGTMDTTRMFQPHKIQPDSSSEDSYGSLLV